MFTKTADVSAYQINVPWKELIDNAGLGCAIIKGDQMTATANHVYLAREAGVPLVALYYWCDPTLSAQYLVDWFANDIREYDPDFIAVDVEQWWASWEEYFDAIAGKIGWGDVKQLSPQAISNHAKAVADGLRKLFPNKLVVIYSATWFTAGHAAPMHDWIGDYPLWWAHYFDGQLGTRQVTWEQLAATPPWPFEVWMPSPEMKWDIWQYSSTMITPAQYARYDWNVFNGTLDEMKRWCKKEITSMGNAYSMDPSLCARVITVTSADARSTVAPKGLGVNAMIIRAGGSNGPGMTVFQDVAWDARQKAAEADGVPVVLWFELDPGWYPANDVDSGMVNDRSGQPDRQPVLLQLLRCLCKDPATSWAAMSAPGFDGWRNVQALMVGQFKDQYLGLEVGDFWFALSIKDIIDQIKVLMDKGTIPALPIILQTSPSLLAKYQEHLGTWLAYKPATTNDSPARSSWLWLAYGGKEVWTLAESHSDFPTIADCWPWTYYNIKQATYLWKYVPDGYEILFHETTQNRLYTPAYTDSAGNARPATLSLSPRLTAAQLAEVLKMEVTPGGGGGGGTETPPVDLSALLARLDTVDANAEANRRIVMQELLSLRARVDRIFK